MYLYLCDYKTYLRDYEHDNLNSSPNYGSIETMTMMALQMNNSTFKTCSSCFKSTKISEVSQFFSQLSHSLPLKFTL